MKMTGSILILKNSKSRRTQVYRENNQPVIFLSAHEADLQGRVEVVHGEFDQFNTMDLHTFIDTMAAKFEVAA